MKTIGLYIITMVLLIGVDASAQLNLNKLKKAIGGESLSTEEIASGLKEALVNGTSKGADLVSQLDGYYKNPEIMIPFPAEVKQVEAR